MRFLGHSECTTKTCVSVLSEPHFYAFILYTLTITCILEADRVIHLKNCVLMLSVSSFISQNYILVPCENYGRRACKRTAS